jgi:hypothetical protein
MPVKKAIRKRLKSFIADNHATLTNSDYGSNSVANGQTQQKLAQPSYPTVSLEPLRREGVQKELSNPRIGRRSDQQKTHPLL